MERIMHVEAEAIIIHPPALGDVPKDRQCLSCKASFPSAWFGERICRRCKSTNAWRNGVPITGDGTRRM